MHPEPSFTNKLNTDAPRASVPWHGSTPVQARTIEERLSVNSLVDGQGWSHHVLGVPRSGGWGLIRDKTAEAPASQQFPGVLCSLGLQAIAHILPRAPVSPTLPACLPALLARGQFLSMGVAREPLLSGQLAKERLSQPRRSRNSPVWAPRGPSHGRKASTAAPLSRRLQPHLLLVSCSSAAVSWLCFPFSALHDELNSFHFCS